MQYDDSAIKDSDVPQKSWSTRLLSERRFFGEFLGLPEVPANEVLPAERTPQAFAARMVELSRARLQFLATQDDNWWLTVVPFFDVERERIWIFLAPRVALRSSSRTVGRVLAAAR